jgi:hypothetical protein
MNTLKKQEFYILRHTFYLFNFYTNDCIEIWVGASWKTNMKLIAKYDSGHISLHKDWKSWFHGSGKTSFMRDRLLEAFNITQINKFSLKTIYEGIKSEHIEIFGDEITMESTCRFI